MLCMCYDVATCLSVAWCHTTYSIGQASTSTSQNKIYIMWQNIISNGKTEKLGLGASLGF